MIKRVLLPRIIDSLKHFPVVGLIGSRQVGKTTLAKEIQKLYGSKARYLDLELPSDARKLESPELYLSHVSDKLVILDEIQRQPSLFPLLRALVDRQRGNGRFLILGSASPDLMKNASESLAGRILYHELTPLNIGEVGFSREKIFQLWLRGGYPKSFLMGSHRLSLEWRMAFIQTHLERDIPQLGIRIPSAQLRRFLMMLANSHGQLWNASSFAKSLGISAPTVQHYVDIFEHTFIVRRLQPYHANIKKRLVKSPKVYIRDSGILHALLGNPTLEAIQSHPLAGHSWEGFCLEQIISTIPENWSYYFYRTSAGAEIDMLLLTDRKTPISLEIKYSLSPTISKGFYLGFNDTKSTRGFVVYPGQEYYPLKDKIYALPLAKLSNMFNVL